MKGINFREQLMGVTGGGFIFETVGDDIQSNYSDKENFDSQTPKSDSTIITVVASDPPQYDSETTDSSAVSTASTETKRKVLPVATETMVVLESMLMSEEPETGISNPSEGFVLELLQDDAMATLNGLSLLFMNNYSVEGKKVNVLVGILHIISHLDYETVYPLGQMMAINALTHRNRQVEEYGIKCFENWGHPDGIKKLEAVIFATEWLREYAEEVINDLGER